MARGSDTFIFHIAIANLQRVLAQGDHDPRNIAVVVEHAAQQGRLKLTLKIAK